MKRIDKLLILLILVMIVLIVVKFVKQEEKTEYKITDSEATTQQLKDEVYRELLYGDNFKYSEINSDGYRVNTSEALKQEKTLGDGLIVKDYKISSQNDITNIDITIYNPTEEEKGDYKAKLVIYNDSDEEIFSLPIYVNKVSGMQETHSIASVTFEIASIYKCEIVKEDEGGLNNNEE